MTLEPKLRPAPPGVQRPAGPALSCPSQSAERRGEGAQVPALLCGHQLVGKAVAPEAALRARLPHAPSEKTAVGPGRPLTALESRRGKESGNEGRRDHRDEEADEEEGVRPRQSPLHGEQNGGAGGGPAARRGRGHSPSVPTLAPDKPVRGGPLAAPGAGGEGKGAARPTMQSVPRRRCRPVAKVKRSGSAADTAPPCPRTRPAPSAAGPTPPRPLFQFYLRIWRQSGFEAGPVSATGGPRRGGQGVGRPGSRRRRMAGARGRRLLGQRTRDEAPR